MPHELDGGNRRFGRLLQDAPPTEPRLPLVHTTDAFQFVEMWGEGNLTPQDCPVFTGEQLTYYFYGRPAFRPNAREDATGLEHYFPVCLIFKPETSVAIRRIFPFDSGAFRGGHYAAYLHRNMKLGDFALDVDPSTPARLVTRFYGSNAAYVFSKDPLDDIPADNLEGRSYLGLSSAKGGNALDSRGSGVEVQGEAAIMLEDALEAVILPMSFVKTETGDRLRAAGIEVLGYATMGRMKPSEHMGSITEVCANYYARRKLLAPGED